ncbi:MAG: hypothetical protein JJT85_06130 [Chromatiales bacterium]|nr:hypothetical protein [Chromatiales bacterium]
MMADGTERGARALIEQLVGGYRVTQMVYVAAELQIADRVAREGPASAASLALACGVQPQALARLLRALAAVGVLEEQPDGRYRLTPAGELLRSDRPDSLRPWVMHYGQPWWWQAWGGMLQAVRSGVTAFEQVNGQPFFDYLRAHPDAMALFNAHMTAMSAPVAAAVAQVLEPGDARIVIDVAGGHGIVLREILRRHPALHGVLFDLPEVIAGVPPVAGGDPLAGRITCAAGNFFEAVPAGGDLYLLKDIVHDWDDARALEILANCRAAMQPNARLLLIECVIRPDDDSPAARLLDISMLVLTGGRERTVEEYARLLGQAGLRLSGVSGTGTAHGIVEARPA